MKNWNVRVSVVEIVAAESEGEAPHALRGRLRNAGFEPYDDDFEVFESEHA